MGCPYDANLKFGFKLTESQASEITKKLNKIEEGFAQDGDWQKEVGDFEPCVFNNEQEEKFYLELSEVASVSNCEYIEELSENEFESSKKEAYRIYDTSPFLKENFNREDIKLLLICNYCG